MPNPPPPPPSPTTGRAESLAPALVIVGVLTFLRIVYLIWLCPYSLVEDEAQYWLWSKHLAWSYYSKGPGIAWVIWLSTSLFGDAEWAVRLPAALASGLAALCVAGLVRDIARSVGAPNSTRASSLALALFACCPAFQMVGVLMTIDGPYVACWAAACWAAWRGMHERSRAAWPILGAALAMGFLFKYTIVLLALGFIVYAFVRRRSLRVPGAVWILSGVGLALLGLAPVVIWNSQHDWATFRHLLGHVGAAGGDAPVASDRGWLPSLKWPIELIGMQLIAAGPSLVLGVWAAWAWCARSGRAEHNLRRAGVAFLISCAAPVLAFYLLVSLYAEPEGNWPIAGHITLLALAGWWISEWLAERRAAAIAGSPRKRGFSPPRFLWHSTIIYALAAAITLHRADFAAAVATRIVMWPPVAKVVLELGGVPKTIRPGRLMSGAPVGAHVSRLMHELEAASGRPAFILADHYGRASQMAYYAGRAHTPASSGWREHIEPAPAFCASAVMGAGGRKSQFDVWGFTNLRNPEVLAALRGRPAIVLSNDKPDTLTIWRSMFERVELFSETGRLDGEHKKDRVAYRAFNFQILPASAGAPEKSGGGR